MGDIREFGPELRRRMEDTGLNQEQVARQAGICSQSRVSAYVGGRLVPTVTILERLDKVFPGLLLAWKDDIQAYHKARGKSRAEKMRAAKEKKTANQREEVQTVDKPPERARRVKRGTMASIGTISRRAREAGMTYGEYVSKFGG